MKKNTVETYLSICAVTLSAALMRLLPHIPNVAPIAALALFSGLKINDKKGFLIPLAAMLVSDAVLGFHATMPFVYGSFLAIALIGRLLRKNESVLKIALGSLSGSVLFFIVTNFGVWATSSMYEKSVAGLMRSYEMGLPFFRNTLVGDLCYAGLFVAGFTVIRSLIVLMLPPVPRTEKA